MYTVVHFSQVNQTKTNERKKYQLFDILILICPQVSIKNLYMSILRFFLISVKGGIKTFGIFKIKHNAMLLC